MRQGHPFQAETPVWMPPEAVLPEAGTAVRQSKDVH